MSTIQYFDINMETLGRTRRVWVYLPSDYSENGSPKPVIYMHDGQNLFFDHLTAYGTAWHVDKALDSLLAERGMSAIVVGVECSDSHRLSEYSPWKINFFAFKEKRTIAKKPNDGGEGEQYARFFAEQLKDFVDGKFNTDNSRNATAVIGSSMGGLISCYLGLKYPQVYETMGLFSTYTEFNQFAFNRFLRNTPQKLQQHAFVYCGGKEGDDYTTNGRMTRNSVALYKALCKRGVKSELVLDSEQKHCEAAWDVHFKRFALEFLQRYYER